MRPPWKAAACAEGGYLEPFVLLEPPAHNTGCCVIGLTYSSGTFVSFFVFTAGCKASGPPGPPLHPPWNPWNIQLSQGTGQGVSMTCNAASRLRSLEDRSAALGSSRCELPGMHSVPKSAVLPYASGVGGLSRRLLNMYICMCRCMYCICLYRTPGPCRKLVAMPLSAGPIPKRNHTGAIFFT